MKRDELIPAKPVTSDAVVHRENDRNRLTLISGGRKSQTIATTANAPKPIQFWPRELREAVRESFFKREESTQRVASKLRVPRLDVEREIRATMFEREAHWALRYQRLAERINGPLPPAPGMTVIRKVA